MPTALLRLCPGGCGARVPSGRCPNCRRASDTQRGTARERGYDSWWDGYSRRRLARYPLCVLCAAHGRTTAATVTDHIQPHKGNNALFRDRRNHQSLCGNCNRLKSIAVERGFGGRGAAAALAQLPRVQEPGGLVLLGVGLDASPGRPSVVWTRGADFLVAVMPVTDGMRQLIARVVTDANRASHLVPTG